VKTRIHEFAFSHATCTATLRPLDEWVLASGGSGAYAPGGEGSGW
jgi:hypothetical protein